MQVQTRKLSSIKPYKGNPRLNEKAVEDVARSIAEFGFRQPIVVDEAGVIVVGHVRYKAARKLGLKTVPVHVAEGLTPKQIRAYRIADNKTADAAIWDPDLLPLELRALQDEGVDLELTGFCGQELADLLGNFNTEVAAPAGEDAKAATVVCPKCGHEFAPGGKA